MQQKWNEKKNKFDLMRLGPLGSCGNGCNVDLSLPSIYPFVYLYHVAFRVCTHRERQMQKSETNRVFIQMQKRKKGKKGKSTTEKEDRRVPSLNGKRPTQTNQQCAATG